MLFNDEGKKALNLLQARAACKLAEVRRLLAPDLEAPYTPEQLLEVAEARLATLPPLQQEKIRMKAVVAYAELEQLMAEMSRHVVEVGNELHAVRARARRRTPIGALRVRPSTSTPRSRRKPMAYANDILDHPAAAKARASKGPRVDAFVGVMGKLKAVIEAENQLLHDGIPASVLETTEAKGVLTQEYAQLGIALTDNAHSAATSSGIPPCTTC